MRDRSPNKPIGTVECSHKGCTESCQVFKFRARSETRTRFAGLLYADCPKHGRFGSDGRPAVQEYILEHADIPNPTTPEAGVAADGKAGSRGTEAAPKSLPAASQKSTGQQSPAKSPETGVSRPWWDKLRTALD